jgi:DNA-binding HxlR family transcriptional regulator
MHFFVRYYPKGEHEMNKQVLEHKGCVCIDAQPFEYALSLIGGKWKLNILFWLWRAEIMRYSQLKRSLTGITHKMLSTQLKELEQDRLIVRHEYPQVPPKVEYYLSERGQSLMPILHELCKWGQYHIHD